MIPHPSSAVQIGTFIGHGRHLRGSPVKKKSVKNNNGDAHWAGHVEGGGILRVLQQKICQTKE